MAVLGYTLALIGGGKAGIIKEGVPVVSAPQKDEALDVLLRIAVQKIGEFMLVGNDVKFEAVDSSLSGQRLRIDDRRQTMDNGQSSIIELQIPLLGSHQLENATTAYAALKASGIPINDEQIQSGFSQVQWRARFE